MQYDKQGDNYKKHFEELSTKIKNLAKQNKNKNNTDNGKVTKLTKEFAELKKVYGTLGNKI